MYSKLLTVTIADGGQVKIELICQSSPLSDNDNSSSIDIRLTG